MAGHGLAGDSIWHGVVILSLELDYGAIMVALWRC